MLRRLRLETRLSQEALAERAHISVQAVSALERGARHAPQRATLDLLASALGLQGVARDQFERAAADSAKARVRDGETHRSAYAPTGLPATATTFFGRDREQAEIVGLLRRKRAVTLWGTGGVGKTRLAIEAADASRDAFADGIFFVELGTVVGGSAVPSAVAAAAGVAESRNRDTTQTLLAALARSHALIILDNCEHVIADASQLVERLIAATTTTILCTSREPLRIGGEHVYELDPLHGPAAVELFIDRAASAGVDAAIDGEDARTIATICSRLDGIPLAIELAAARMASMEPREIAAALDQRFRLLTRGSRTASSRQQTLAGALDWSYDLLKPAEQLAFRRLAVLNGSWTLDDALAVAGDGTTTATERWRIADLVADLIDKALLIVAAADGEQRHRMLETTRDYAAIKLRESGELAAIERRHAQHVRAAAESALAAYRAGDDQPFDQLDADNVRAVLHWSIVRGNDPAFGAALAGAVSPFWDALGFHVEGLRWIDDSIAFLDPNDTSPAAVEAWLGKSRLSGRLELHRESHLAAERAIALADRGSEPALRGMARILSAYAAANTGDHAGSTQRIDEAEAIFTAGAIAGGMARVLHARAFAAFRSGRPAEARDALERVAAQHRADGSPRNEIHATIDLAEAEYGLGNRDAAIARSREALAAARALGAVRQVTAVLDNLAAYLLDAGDVDGAAAAAHEACTLAYEQRYGLLTAIAIQHCAFVAALRDRARDATMLTGYADRVFRDAAPRGYTEQHAHDALVATLRDRLTARDLTDALHDGELLSEADAVDIALRSSAPAPAP